MTAVKSATDATIDQMISDSNTPVVIDFWAPWCAPCKAISQVLEKYAAENSGCTIIAVNVDENPVTASKYGVRGLPTLFLMKGGSIIASRSGSMGEAAFKEWLKAAA